jgi:hypothetical protein
VKWGKRCLIVKLRNSSCHLCLAMPRLPRGSQPHGLQMHSLIYSMPGELERKRNTATTKSLRSNRMGLRLVDSPFFPKLEAEEDSPRPIRQFSGSRAIDTTSTKNSQSFHISSRPTYMTTAQELKCFVRASLIPEKDASRTQVEVCCIGSFRVVLCN